MNYDTSLFIDIIESVPGINFLRSDYKLGIHARFYEGLTGKLVIIETTDEDLDDEVGKGYLERLGLGYLIPSIFPEQTEEDEEDEEDDDDDDDDVS